MNYSSGSFVDRSVIVLGALAILFVFGIPRPEHA
jgi:hypothetical protein